MRKWVVKNLPACAAFAAAVRAEFGDARMAFASEGGNVLGKRCPEGVKLSETVVGPMALAKTEKRL